MIEFNLEKKKDVCKSFKNVALDIGRLSKIIDVQFFDTEDDAVNNYSDFMDEYERVMDNLERARKDATLLYDSVINW